MKSQLPVLGIEFGTTNLAGAYWDGERIEVVRGPNNGGLLPAAFGWHNSSSTNPDGVFLIGEPALYAPPEQRILAIRRLLGRSFSDPDVEIIKRRFPFQLVETDNGGIAIDLNGRNFTPEEVAGHLMRELRSRAEDEVCQALRNVVLTVPLYYTERERQAVRAAADHAGFDAIEIIDESTALVLAIQDGDAQKRENLLAIHFGGGTCDVSILRADRGSAYDKKDIYPLQVDGDLWLGGDDFDRRICQHILDRSDDTISPTASSAAQLLEHLLPYARIAKQHLSRSDAVQIRIPACPSFGQTAEIELTLTRGTYEELIDEDVNRVMAIVTRSLEQRAMTWSDVSGVLLAGGATLTPLVRRRMSEIFGPTEVYRGVDPFSAAATGAVNWFRSQTSGDRRAFRTANTRKSPKKQSPVVLSNGANSRDQATPASDQSTKKTDVFISSRSTDYEHAAQVFEYLVSNGIPAFFSPESLPELGSSDYRREIDRALDEATHMIVVTSTVENVLSPWVEAEWGFFINEKRSGRKDGNLITLVTESLEPGDLPPSLRYYEVLSLQPKSFERLMRYIA